MAEVVTTEDLKSEIDNVNIALKRRCHPEWAIKKVVQGLSECRE